MSSRASTAAVLPSEDEQYEAAVPNTGGASRRSAKAPQRAAEAPGQDGAQIGHDLSRFDSRKTVRDVRSEESRAVPARRRKAAAKPRLNILTFLCSAAGVVIATALIASYVNLTILNDQIKKLKDEYVTLENKGVMLKTEYESRYDLNQIEAYATGTLGMVKMGRSQIEYVEIPNPDVIMKVAPEENNSIAYVVANFVKSFNAVLEYLEK